MEPTKVCCRCKETKLHSAFYRDARTKDGRRGHCCLCAREYAQRWYAANSERVIKAVREYGLANPDKVAAASHRWYVANSEKVAEQERRRCAADPERTERKNAAGRRWHAANSEHAAERGQRWREANPERKAETNRRWRAANPERVIAYQQTSAERWPERAAARRALWYALDKGRLTAPNTCQECHKPSATQGHHWSYEPEHRLSVVWLCLRCHGLVRRKRNRPRFAFEWVLGLSV